MKTKILIAVLFSLILSKVVYATGDGTGEHTAPSGCGTEVNAGTGGDTPPADADSGDATGDKAGGT